MNYSSWCIRRHAGRGAAHVTLQTDLAAQLVAWGDLTHIVLEYGYYHQVHMHWEFVEMSGLPPIQLLQEISSDDPAY